jgi:hypothetical protein
MVANSLAKMVSVAQQNGLVVGLADNIIARGIAMLQYADDTILLIQDDLNKLEISSCYCTSLKLCLD